MFKTGICRATQFKRLENGPHSVSISLSLLSGAFSDDPRDTSIFETIVRELRLASGIYRTTYPRRFTDVNAAVNPLLARAFRNRPWVVHDWAASDCLATAEWAQSLREANPNCRVVASDILFHLVEISRNGGAYILQPDGEALQYVQPPFVVSLQQPIPAYYPVNRIIAKRAQRRLEEARLVLRQCRWEGIDDFRVFDVSGWQARRLPLLHPMALRARAEGVIEIRTHSVLEALADPCNAIRTMNVFRTRSFGEEGLLKAFRCVWSSLVDGGIWIVGRTTEESSPVQNKVTIFQKTEVGFCPLLRMHEGSEVEALATGMADLK